MPGPPAQALPRALAVAGAEAAPGSGRAGGRKARHVAAEFGRDHLGRAAGDAGERVEPGEGLGVRGGERLDLAIARGDRVVEELDVTQEVVEQEAMGRRDAAGERLAEGRALAAQAPLGQVRQLVRALLARNERLEHRPRRHPEDPCDDTRQLDVGRLEHLLERFASCARSSITRLP